MTCRLRGLLPDDRGDLGREQFKAVVEHLERDTDVELPEVPVRAEYLVMANDPTHGTRPDPR